MGHFSDPVLARTAPADLTIADCVEGWLDVAIWCAGRCGGRPVDLARLKPLSERKVLDLMREGVFTCKKCKKFADAVSINSSEHADRILFWRLGDDAMPS
jgi:hypothetical protein